MVLRGSGASLDLTNKDLGAQGSPCLPWDYKAVIGGKDIDFALSAHKVGWMNACKQTKFARRCPED